MSLLQRERIDSLPMRVHPPVPPEIFAETVKRIHAEMAILKKHGLKPGEVNCIVADEILQRPRSKMKLFQERQIRKAYEFAVAGEQALHVFSDPGLYPRAPAVFKKSKQAAHLFDQNMIRLTVTAKQLGVRVIKVSCEGTKKQHVDLCGKPLKRAIELCDQILSQTLQDDPG